MREVNGEPGAIFRDRDSNVFSTLALDIAGGRIQAIRSVINPDKLAHLGPVTDAHAVVHEADQARRKGQGLAVDRSPAATWAGHRTLCCSPRTGLFSLRDGMGC